MRFGRKALFGPLALTLASLALGCASTAPKIPWIGRAQSEVVKSKGRPTEVRSDTPGHSVLVYVRSIPWAKNGQWDSGSLPQTQRINWNEEFVVDEGIVTSYSMKVVPDDYSR